MCKYSQTCDDVCAALITQNDGHALTACCETRINDEFIGPSKARPRKCLAVCAECGILSKPKSAFSIRKTASYHRDQSGHSVQWGRLQ